MRPPDLLRAVRDTVADVPGIATCHYPAPNALGAMPAVVLYWDGDEPTAITHMSWDEQQWAGTLTGHLVTARKGNTPQEFAAVDDLIVPIVDAFAVDSAGRSVVERQPARFGGVVRCIVTAARPTQEIEFAGQAYYGAVLTWTYRIDRTTGSD